MSTDLALRSPRSGSMANLMDTVGNFDNLFRMSEVLLASRMLPESIGTPEAAMAIMLKGHELGIGPMAAFNGIHVIKGKPTVSPQLMLSLILTSGLCQDYSFEDDGQACTVTMKRKGKSSPFRKSFSMADARSMGLASMKQWQSQPETMRQWRALSACCRIAFPDVIEGMYLPEEMGAEVDEDGEIVTAEVVEAKPAIQNHSGHATGKFASPDQVATFRDKFNGFLSKKQGEYEASWEWALEKGLDVPSGDVMHRIQALKHLLKWAKANQHLDKKLQLDAVSGDQPEKYLAIVYHASKESRIALGQEMERYYSAKAEEKRAAWCENHREACNEHFGTAEDVEETEAVDPEIVEAEDSKPPADEFGEIPTNGQQFSVWAKAQEQRFEVGLLKYIQGWGKLQDMPSRIVDWDRDQVASGHSEATRKLRLLSANHGDSYEEALEN